MAKLTKKAITLLRKVEKKIVEEPLRLKMSGWGIVWGYGYEDDESVPACRTTACLAGWTILLDRPKLWDKLLKAQSTDMLRLHVPNQDPGAEAGIILGISEQQQDRLFHVCNWPTKYVKNFYHASLKERARATVNRIEHFIKTDGAE